MRTRIGQIFLLAFLTLALLCGVVTPADSEMPGQPPGKIISLAPSTTETLFALGLGGNVVGVTRYCDYPEPARSVARVGGFFDPNYEQIVALQPDLVVLLTSHRNAMRELKKMGIRTLAVPHKTIGDIHESIRAIGEACGADKAAAALLRELDDRSRRVRSTVQGRQRRRVLVCIGRDTETGKLSGMYMAGRQGFYHELIESAGGINANEDETVAYPQLSAEGVIRVNPDVIVDLVSHIKPGANPPAQIIRQWDRLSPVTAVQEGRVYAIVGNHALRPGPRYVQFLEQLARLLHPEAFAGGVR